MALSFFMRKKPGDRKGPRIFKTEAKKEAPPAKIIERVSNGDKKPFYAFIDASNLFWGGKESMGFGVDYRKLKRYLENKFNVTKIFFYNGVRIFDFEYLQN